MAQRRFWNFQDEDSTFDLSRWWLGIFEPGLYRGFDFIPSNNQTMLLSHDITGIVQTQLDQALSNKTGCLFTKQGVVIQEDEPISLAVQPAHATLPRKDLVIVTHIYQETDGGAMAYYSVLQGTPAADPVPPALSNPEKQTVLGTLYLPGGAASLIDPGVVFTKNSPELANREKFTIPENIAILDQVQTFTAYHIFQLLGIDVGTATFSTSTRRIQLSEKGVLFELPAVVSGNILQISDRDDLEVIILQFGADAVLVHDGTPDPVEPEAPVQGSGGSGGGPIVDDEFTGGGSV